MSPLAASPRFRLWLILWLAGLLGAVVMTVTVLPQLLATMPLPAPLWVLSIASFAQSSVLIGLATWAGVALAPAVGLRAPAFEAAAFARPIAPALSPQLVPGVVAGVVGGFLLFAVTRIAPTALASLQERFSPPILARVLYGGVTEELLLRWGLMTTVLWLAWRFVQRRDGVPKAAFAWLAIAISALLFGAGHLPAAKVLLGTLEAPTVIYVLGANSAFGIAFGVLFWRFGLEAAMIAHAVAHVVNYVATLLAS
ncbi:MAG: CPBP family intramembrane metalloprotease [Acidobacteria bacterium]|nr:CPBP family intramembrane metalloprotease [Acidobacteriota bacterium]